MPRSGVGDQLAAVIHKAAGRAGPKTPIADPHQLTLTQQLPQKKNTQPKKKAAQVRTKETQGR